MANGPNRGWLVTALVLSALGCLTHDERTALYLFDLQRQQALSATQAFLTATADRDTTAMKAVATDSLVMMMSQGDTAGLRAASETLRPTHFEVARCKGRLEFRYAVGRETQNGATDIACRGDDWVITRIALVVEH
jgi:hypothetical protein